MQKTKGEQQFDSSSLANVDLPLPPPIVKTEESAFSNPDIPGDLTSVENDLRKTYYTYENPISYLRDSMNNWLKTILPQTLDVMPIHIDENIKIRFMSVYFKRPATQDGRPIYPYDAEANGLTLTTQLLVKLGLFYRDEESPIEIIDDVSLGYVPVMTGTVADNTYGLTERELFDIGQCISDRNVGYFIIKGVPKIITIRKKLRENRFITYVRDNKSGTFQRTITNATPSGRTKVTLVIGNKLDIRILLKQTLGSSGDQKDPRHLNVYQAFKILNPEAADVETITANILQFTKHPRRVRNALTVTMLEYEAEPDDVYQIIASITDNKIGDIALRNENIRNSLLAELFPQSDISEDTDFNISLKYRDLAYMTCRYAELLADVRGPENRDPIGNSMYETPGMAYGRYFTELLKTAMEGDNNSLRSKINSDNTFNLASNNRDILLERVDSTTRARTLLLTIKKHMDGTVVKKVSSDMERAFTDGWTIKNNKENIVDTLKEEGTVMRYSQSTRINIPTSPKGKQFAQRSVKMSQTGYICLMDSPEGQRIGLVEHVAITTYLTQYVDDAHIVSALVATLVADQEGPSTEERIFPRLSNTKDAELGLDTILVLNGKVLFWCNGDDMYQTLLLYRRSGATIDVNGTDTILIHPATMILYDREFNEILVYTDAGRMIRPLLITNPATGMLVIDELDLWKADFETLMKNGAVEYVDAAEAEYLDTGGARYGKVAQTLKLYYVGMRNRERLRAALQQMESAYSAEPNKNSLLAQIFLRFRLLYQQVVQDTNYSHCEMNPSSITGFSGSLIPLPNHNSGAKNVFQCGMGKQALSAVHSVHSIRYPTSIKVLSYPQRPIFENQMTQMLGLDSMPAGQNVIVAMTPYFGWNQEDAIIFNKASVDRGLFHYIVYKTVKAKVKNTNEFSMIIERGNLKAAAGKPDPYRNLDTQGVVKIGSRVAPGDILVSMVRKSRIAGAKAISDVSVKAPLGVYGIVDKVYKVRSNNSISEVKIKIRDARRPEPSGDKFSSRYAQKGVTGIMLPPEDMLYTQDGLVPDVIINPLGFISRMTVGKVIEIVTGKVALMRGERIDSTAFRPFNMVDFQAELKRLGFSESGGERMYRGTDGQMMEAIILTGPCYYQALRHHVRDKIQARARGAIKIDTFQPVKGRAKGGGGRFGRQEREALVTHGAAYAIRDIFLLSSDAIDMVYCTSCGTVCEIDISGAKKCHMCTGSASFAKCQITGPFKALTHFMAGQGINVRAEIREVAQKTDYGLDPIRDL